MDDDRKAWVTQMFRAVDERFGDQWEISFETVHTRLHSLDTYWDSHPGVPRTGGGLIRLCAPGASDYYLIVRDIARKTRSDMQ